MAAGMVATAREEDGAPMGTARWPAIRSCRPRGSLLEITEEMARPRRRRIAIHVFRHLPPADLPLLGGDLYHRHPLAMLWKSLEQLRETAKPVWNSLRVVEPIHAEDQ